MCLRQGYSKEFRTALKIPIFAGKGAIYIAPLNFGGDINFYSFSLLNLGVAVIFEFFLKNGQKSINVAICLLFMYVCIFSTSDLEIRNSWYVYSGTPIKL